MCFDYLFRIQLFHYASEVYVLLLLSLEKLNFYVFEVKYFTSENVLFVLL